MRIIGLDFGTKRIGVALSDELLITAQGRDPIFRTSDAEDIAALKAIIEANSVSEVVVGLPLNMDGTYSQKTKEAAAFADAVSKDVNVPVRTWDERLTSVQAENIMLEANLSRSKRKKNSDKIAAQLILQSYLDSRRVRKGPDAQD